MSFLSIVLFINLNNLPFSEPVEGLLHLWCQHTTFSYDFSVQCHKNPSSFQRLVRASKEVFGLNERQALSKTMMGIAMGSRLMWCLMNICWISVPITITRRWKRASRRRAARRCFHIFFACCNPSTWLFVVSPRTTAQWIQSITEVGHEIFDWDCKSWCLFRHILNFKGCI